MRNLLVGLVVAGAIAGTFYFPSGVYAGVEGPEDGDEDIQFLVPKTASAVASHQKVVLIDGPLGSATMNGNTCGVVAGTYPVQNAVLVDPHGGAHVRFAGVVVLYPVPFKPGTRLGSVRDLGPCSDNGTTYQKMAAILE